MEKTIMKLDLNHQSAMFDVVREMLKQNFMDERFSVGSEIAKIDEGIIRIRQSAFTVQGMIRIRKEAIELAAMLVRLASNVERHDTGGAQVWFECDSCGARNWTETFFPGQESDQQKLIECPECANPLFVIKPKPEGPDQ